MLAVSAWRKLLLHFIWTCLLAVLLSTLAQTQFNLLALQQLGIAISFSERLTTSLHDLRHFAPVYAAIFSCSYLVSQSIAFWLRRWVASRWQVALFALAAGIGLLCTLLLVNALAPMPTLIAASRSLPGLLSLLLMAALAGALFARALQQSSGAGSNRQVDASALAALLLPVMLLNGLVTPAASAVESDYRIETLVNELEHPWSLAFLSGGTMLVTERPGRLRLIHADGRLEPEPIAGLPTVFASGQAGLFDVVPAPDFAQSQQIFLSYACGRMRANHTCLARARLDLSRLELTELTEIFRTYPAKTGNAHYGGRLAFLSDGSLVLSLGDGFDYREEAQRLSSHLGSIVRLWPDGTVPEDNPFFGQTGALAEIYSYGHRNVQGLVYDSANQQLLSHEHGPKGGDELNRIQPGLNYGWPVVTQGIDYTGARITPFTAYQGMQLPLLDWTPSIAPSGLTLYQGDLFVDWQGDLLVGALAGRQLQRVRLTEQGAEIVEVLLAELAERIRDVRTGPDGALYVLTDDARGRLLRITPALDGAGAKVY
ncbi:PQQ-dependent sugar dehydrogenase [Alkalimonas amylolytica]|uniref:Glucose/arabinose dehydrogenase, beta-propeller fold n=1 Tax=Alkalimonas amylolytica TaxID=152573 RepID=A0A1H3Z7M2_ALKAM|nr:PQQ-dependent sugar dehydrogenase [Alkalimonas amylolytica]SEA19667.1 Glucose/arabinose dehydrogenase, beta-propeller fold [Alkalimonas amylolytica]